MTISNPYFTGGLAAGPQMFFGREEELRLIRDRLRKGDSTAVVGLRRMGKSSLLYQLARQTPRLSDGILPVYLDWLNSAERRMRCRAFLKGWSSINLLNWWGSVGRCRWN